MHAERDTWTLFVTVVGLSLLVFCTNLTLLTYGQKEDINICPKYSKNLGNFRIVLEVIHLISN